MLDANQIAGIEPSLTARLSDAVRLLIDEHTAYLLTRRNVQGAHMGHKEWQRAVQLKLRNYSEAYRRVDDLLREVHRLEQGAK